MGFGVAFLFAAAHLTGGLAPGSRSSVPDDWHAETGGRFAVTTPSGATRTHRFASDAELRTPKVIRSVVAPAPRSPSSPRSPPNPNPTMTPPSAAVSSSVSSSGSATHAGSEPSNVGASHEDRGVDEFDARVAARRAAERFRATCGAADAFFAAAGARYAPGSLRRDPSLGVLIIDWSENHFNGIGDEMQHYQEMLAIGLGTGRAAYLQTQPRACRGTGLGGSPAPPSVAHVVEACRFDLGDFFTGIRGVDWRWDGEKERKVADELGVAPEAARADELVVTWSPKGMYYRTGRDGVAEGEAESPDGTYVAPPDANSIEVMMNDPVVRGARVVRIRIKQSFGHWCHPHQRGDWGMCASYRWIVGVRMTNDGNRSAEASGSSEPSPCPSCAVGGCFGAAIAHPRDFLKRQMAPYLREMERGNWTAAVAAHVRVGFADVSAVAPPTRAFSRRENATLAGMDAFLAEEAERVPFPEPECPAADIAKRTGADRDKTGPDRDGGFAGVPNASAPLSSFLRCAAATGRALASGPDAPWGVFLMTDAPGVRAVVFAEAKRLGLPSVLATDGAYGHVKAGNTGVCAEAAEASCDASDPRGAWSRSMADMALMGFADVEVMLFQSKFGAAASMRAAIPHGLREFYRDARLTHSLVAPLADEMAGRGGAPEGADAARAETWTRLWDLFGPAGAREGLRTSRYAVGSASGDGSARTSE